jgi:hypothetical protein
MEVSNELLREAFLKLALEEFRNVPPEDEIELEFSEGFEERLRKRLREEPDPPLSVKWVRSRPLRRLAVAVILLAMLAVTAVATPAIREGLIGFFTQNKGTHYELSYDPEQAATAPKTIETEYFPAYIPEEFFVETTSVTTEMAMHMWKNNTGSYIYYAQEVISPGSEGPYVDSEDVEASLININGYSVFRVVDEGFMYYWTDNSYFYSLVFSSDIPEAEGLKVFCSLVEK